MKLYRLILASLFLQVAVVSAEIVFETKTIEVAVKLGQKEADIVFPFEIKNGPTTVVSVSGGMFLAGFRIESLNSDRSAKLEWKEGESGQITVRANTSHLKGEVEKSFAITLKDKEEPILLTVRFVAPELIKMTPQVLKWEQGGVADEKVIEITINHDEPIKILKDVGRNDKVFPYTLKTIREGWKYEIRVTPTDTSEVVMGMIKLTTDSPFQEFQKEAVYMVIRPTPKISPEVKG